MKKLIAFLSVLLFCTVFLFAEETVQRKFYLKGEKNGVEVSIDLSNFYDSAFHNGILELKNGNSNWGKSISDLKVLMEPFHVTVKNNSDKTINMNWVYDSFIVAVERKSGIYQIEYELLETKDNYPKKILKGAKASFSIPSKINTVEKILMWNSEIEPYAEYGTSTYAYCAYINDWNEELKNKESAGTLAEKFYKPLSEEDQQEIGNYYGKQFSATFTLGIENIKEIEINLVPYLEITNVEN